MPTTGSAPAFTELVQARNELSNIIRELNAVYPDRDANTDAKAKYIELVRRRARARQDFKLATERFTSTVKNGDGSPG
jgi:hypothetical protein